jgi:hypothetical protein
MNKFETKLLRQCSEHPLVEFAGFEETQILYTPPTKQRVYTPDITVIVPYKMTPMSRTKYRTMFIEAKGYFRPETQRMMKWVKEQNPELDIRFVFYKDKPIRKGAKLTYMGWAEKYGFPACINIIPQEWFK